jgi:hypothetical protein
LLGGAALALVCGVLGWSVLYDYLDWLWFMPFDWIVPDSWARPDHVAFQYHIAYWLYFFLTAALLAWICGRAGRWPEVWRRYLAPALGASQVADAPAKPGAKPGPAGSAAEQDAAVDPVEWPELRRAGAHGAAEVLAGELRGGRMNDVDYVRLRRAWEAAQRDPGRVAGFVEAVARDGAAAFPHPSRARDLPVRTAPHDLLAAQVRLGRALPDTRNPYQHRGAGLALEPALLGTGLLVVGPPGSGKTRHVLRPVTESLCLQALAGTAAVLVVAAAGTDLGPAEAYDVVIAPGDPASRYDLDLYGGTADPDEAAGVLAEALAEDDTEARRAATALAQLLGPFRAAHGRFPAVPELRELLDGDATALAGLREALDASGAPEAPAQARELDARRRQAERAGDVGPLLADRIALLDRAAFAGFFDVTGRTRPFSPRALEHPLRVRVDLPERGHAEASRLLARLLVAQFGAAMAARPDRSLFACLVLDDAAHAVSAGTVRTLQRLRGAHAGAALALRSLDGVPEELRSALLGAAGCRMAMSGVATWDGRRFAEAWGTTWVEARDVTRTPDRSGGVFRKLGRGVRRLFTGEAATTESVTVRRVERERWSASELAHAVPAGHAVVSLTRTDGEHVPPILVDLRS